MAIHVHVVILKYRFSTSQVLLAMYRQEYNQNYGQHESYGQYHGQYAGYNTDSAAPGSYGSQPRIVLDDYNSDLNFVIEPDGVTGSSLHKDGFEYMWAGARATHGIRTGKVRSNKTLVHSDVESVNSFDDRLELWQ